MKKIILFAILASFCLWLGCNKAEQEPVPVTPTEVSDVDFTNLGDDPTGQVVFRDPPDCESCPLNDCCCRLTVTGPSSATVNVGFCSSVFPSGTSCFLGDNTNCGDGANSNLIDTDLSVGVTDEDYKQWCAGPGGSVPFVITNNYGSAVQYTIDCGGPNDPLNFTLQAGQNAYITKDGNCNSTRCIYP